MLLALSVASNGASSAEALRRRVPKQTVIGLFRDLRGIALASNSRRTYGAQGPASDRRWGGGGGTAAGALLQCLVSVSQATCGALVGLPGGRALESDLRGCSGPDSAAVWL